ncbi:hypothetical protein K438DRAFT_695903 [Mycena galopus ATCC 62051]|nr:hypothetical protein K438DRAFT_695903 [Mycena galopus ATCC 62051]
MAHLAGIEKNNESAAKHQATRHRNLEAARHDTDRMRAMASSPASQPGLQQQAGASGTHHQSSMQPPVHGGSQPNPLEGTAMPMAPMVPISQSAEPQGYPLLPATPRQSGHPRTMSMAPMHQNVSSFCPNRPFHKGLSFCREIVVTILLRQRVLLLSPFR